MLAEFRRLEPVLQEGGFIPHIDHRCPDEPELVVRAGNAGYEVRMISENIASAMNDPAEAVRSWMTSEGHRENMLDPDMREIGVGFVLLNEDGGKQRSRQYWVQNFGAPGQIPGRSAVR